MHKFLITGLPRSRTAWMATFMTVGDSVCLHEPKNWRAMWAYEGAKHVGISDSGLGFQLQEIIDEFSPRVLIIDRPVAECNASLEALNTGLPITNFCEELKKHLDSILHPSIMRIPFHMLNDMRAVQKAFWHLVPGEAFDEGRYLALKDINIEIDITHLLKEPPSNYVIPKGVTIQ